MLDKKNDKEDLIMDKHSKEDVRDYVDSLVRFEKESLGYRDFAICWKILFTDADARKADIHILKQINGEPKQEQAVIQAEANVQRDFARANSKDP